MELQRAIGILPSSDALLLLARVYFDEGRWEEAMAQLRLLVRVSENGRLRREIGEFLRKYDKENR